MFNSSIRSVVVVALAYLSYVISAILQTSLWAGIAAPAFDFLAVGLIFYAVFTSKNKQYKWTFVLAGTAVLFWAVADLLWLVYGQFLHIDPGNSNLITVFYFGTNIFLVAATVYFVYHRLRKWDSVQLLLDSVVFSLAFMWLLWELLYGKQLTGDWFLANSNILNSISIGIDVFIIVLIGIWYLSIRKGKIPLFVRILTFSLVLYAINDLIYFHQFTEGLYLSDTLIDILYLTSLFGLAVSVTLYYAKYPSVYDDRDQNTNIGGGHKGLYLVFCPVLILILTGLDGYDIAFYLLLILTHEYASAFIQRSIDNKVKFQQGCEMNRNLEQLVSEQTQDLKSTNEELRQRNAELSYTNYHDLLTGLYNRAYFFQKLEEFIKESSRDESVVLVLWNIDKLKSINETYGYAIGDQILVWHADRVQKQYAGLGVLARLGGDEFVFAMTGHYQDEEMITIGERVIEACKEPLQLNEYVFNITASVGVSLFPLSASNASDLLKTAAIAMRHAKETQSDHHLSRYRDIKDVVNRRSLIACQLYSADYNQAFSLHYQPQFSIKNRKLIGMEALLRWDCPGLDPVSPTEFIPIAEKENLIIPIGNWVMENAVRQIADWNQGYQTDFRMGINISPMQLDQASTFDVLNLSVTRFSAKYSWIDLEITEGLALNNEDSAKKIKNLFKDKGITVSIDDFGTGYSSLGYLNILSYDKLKIAKELIDKIAFDESSRKIVTSIILLAHSLGLHTIAEGVETKAQFDLLLELGCEQIQGYYLGRPIPAEEFENKYLKQQAKSKPSKGNP